MFVMVIKIFKQLNFYKMKKLELTQMGLAPMHPCELQEVDGGTSISNPIPNPVDIKTDQPIVLGDGTVLLGAA